MNRPLKRIVTSLLFACSASALAQAPVDSLTDAAARAIAANPEVEARWHAFKASRAEQEVARGGFMPQIDLSANVGAQMRKRPNVEDDDFTRRGAALSINQMLYDGFETRSEVARLGHASLVRYYELLDGAEDVALEAATAYLDVLRYRELVRLAKENYVQHKQVFDQISQRVKAGVGRRVDLEQASGRLALAESNLLTESSNLHDVSARYQRIVGEVPPDALPSADIPAAGIPATIGEALNAAYAANPALAAAHQNVRAAQAEARAKRAGYRPRVDLRAREQYGWNTDGIDGDHRDRVLEVVLNYNLFRGGSDRARIRQFAEQLNQAQDLRDKSCRDLRQSLVIAHNDIARLGEQLEYLDQHQLSIEKAREAYRKQFDIGQRTLLDLLDTENEYFDARRAYTQAIYDLSTAKARTLDGMGALMQTLGLVREDLPTPDEIDKGRERVDVSAACPAEAPVQQRFDKAALLAGVAMPAAAIAPTAVPAAAPVSDKALASSVEKRLNSWVEAWSRRDVAGYLSFYSRDFKTEDGRSRAAWEEQRRRRVGKSSPISVDIDRIKTGMIGDDRAVTEFRQRYRSADYRDRVTKQLTWMREAGTWRIVRERALQR